MFYFKIIAGNYLYFLNFIRFFVPPKTLAMASAADGGTKPAGMEALHRLKTTEPPLYLTPSPELSKAARLASEYLFASLNPYTPKSPFSHLLIEGFDAEQIWQQIDLQAQPLLSSLRRQVRNFEKNPKEIEKQFNLDKDSGKKVNFQENENIKENDGEESESESEGLDDDDELDEDNDDGEEEGEENDEEDKREMEIEDKENVNGVEDKFLKIKELEEYLVEDEAREYGLKTDKKNKRRRAETADESDEDEDEGEEEDEDGEEDEEEEDDEV